MPLSKARDRERMRQSRLHVKDSVGVVQPTVADIMKANPLLSMSVKKRLAIQAGIEFDIDGNQIYGEG